MAVKTLQPITGLEQGVGPKTPYGAFSEFYRAFNARDLELMSTNWLNSIDVSMDNPLGGIRRGWEEIAEVYQRIFSGKGLVNVEFFDYTIHPFGETFLAVGRERGAYRDGITTLELKFRTSRWFWFVDGRFRQLHHHGSIEDARLLAQYQAAVH
jgi:hypothetical protein